MPKNKKTKRKLPVTTIFGSSSVSQSSSSNPLATRKVIRRYHVLLKRENQIKRILARRNDSAEQCSLREESTSIQDELERMGGLAAYQRMSTIGQGTDRGGGSERILLQWLRELGAHIHQKQLGSKFRLLEVGALKPDNYADNSAWIEVFPIDLHSQHPAIVEQDFLQMSSVANMAKWDIISLSLVLNFVPDPKDRGRMLRLAHTMLRDGGYLFLALPLPCVMNSRYLTEELFDELMQFLSFRRINARWKEGGKMVYWLYQKAPDPDSLRSIERPDYTTKRVVRTGNRNNFAILL